MQLNYVHATCPRQQALWGVSARIMGYDLHIRRWQGICSNRNRIGHHILEDFYFERLVFRNAWKGYLIIINSNITTIYVSHNIEIM